MRVALLVHSGAFPGSNQALPRSIRQNNTNGVFDIANLGIRSDTACRRYQRMDLPSLRVMMGTRFGDNFPLMSVPRLIAPPFYAWIERSLRLAA